MADVIVIGGGAAGMMAACTAAECGHAVVLVEHNEKLGKKIYITGKGRCNLTNACDVNDFFDQVPRNAKFLYSSIYTFDNHALMDWFSSRGLQLKTERGDRVFPVSDHASDVTRILYDELRRQNVRIMLNTEVLDLLYSDTQVCGVRIRDRHTESTSTLAADDVIVATGGLSYPQTGSDGSMFKILKKSGHTVTKMRPSLVPMNVRESYIRQLQGLSLKNVQLTIFSGKKRVYSGFGEMLFTHFGISGPLVLSASGMIPDRCWQDPLSMEIDLKPALSEEKLDSRILRDFQAEQNKMFRNSLGHLLPSRLIAVMIQLSGIDPEKPVHSITKAERRQLVQMFKHFPATITGLRGFQEAVITRGGISVKEVDPSTMQSKKIQNLFLCGEMLDVDAMTGGFNLQIAWSTGHLAGSSIDGV